MRSMRIGEERSCGQFVQHAKHHDGKTVHASTRDFNMGSTGGAAARAVFPAASVTGVQFYRQTGTGPASFTDSTLPISALNIFPGAIGQIAYGTFTSPDYETAEKYIPATSTLTGAPQPQGTNNLLVQIFLPSGSKPAGGWPVAIFGAWLWRQHVRGALGCGIKRWRRVASPLPRSVVGHGGGALGTLQVQGASSSVVIPAGGRGIDQDGTGTELLSLHLDFWVETGCSSVSVTRRP